MAEIPASTMNHLSTTLNLIIDTRDLKSWQNIEK